MIFSFRVVWDQNEAMMDDAIEQDVRMAAMLILTTV